MCHRRFRRVVAGASLLAAAVGLGLLGSTAGLTSGALLGNAAKIGSEPVAGVTRGDAAGLAASVRSAAGLPYDGRPALLVVLDPSCGACEAARDDLQEDGLGLEGAGVHVASIERERLAAAGASLPPGFFPAYLLYDSDGQLLASRRGYASPEGVAVWVRDHLLSSPMVTPAP